jgi:Protein of unknown function (DUF3311)
VTTYGRRRLPRELSPWHALLLIPVGAPLLIPLYNRSEPALFGLPFFYWSQLALAVTSILVTTIVFLATKRPR